MESPSETPYLFNLPRTKVIGRVTRAADIDIVRDTLGLKERGIDSRSPHPLQETYLRTMKSNHAILYLQKKGEAAQYVPLKVEEVQIYSSSTEKNDDRNTKSISNSPIFRNGRLKQLVLEKDFDSSEIDLYYNVLHTLRDMGDRGVIYSALSEMLHDTADEKHLAKATINLIKKRYVFRKEYTPRDSYKPLTTIRISPKGLQAIEEYEMKNSLKIQQSIDASKSLTDSNDNSDKKIEIDHPELPKTSLIDGKPEIENYLKSIEEKTAPNARDLLKQAHELRNNYPQAATSSIVFCYDAIKIALLRLLEIDTDAKIELDQIVRALINCEIALPIDYSGLQNIIQKHKLAIIQGIMLEQADIDSIIGDTELIIAELEKFKLKVRDRIRVIKQLLSEKEESFEEQEIENIKGERIDSAENFVNKIIPSETVVETLPEASISFHDDLKLNGLLKDIWDITGREGGLKSVIKNQLILKNTGYDNLGIERAINAMINRGLLRESDGFLQRCEFTENV
jgi:hypothetical protein